MWSIYFFISTLKINHQIKEKLIIQQRSRVRGILHFLLLENNRFSPSVSSKVLDCCQAALLKPIFILQKPQQILGTRKTLS